MTVYDLTEKVWNFRFGTWRGRETGRADISYGSPLKVTPFSTQFPTAPSIVSLLTFGPSMNSTGGFGLPVVYFFQYFETSVCLTSSKISIDSRINVRV